MLETSRKKLIRIVNIYALNAILLVGVFGVLTSLYFSQVLDLPPCDLCWYQRILFFPVPLIALIGLLNKDRKALNYILFLSVVGLPISIYHHLLKVTSFFSKETVFCGHSGACSDLDWELWTGSGVTIPFLVAIAFVIIAAISLVGLSRRV